MTNLFKKIAGGASSLFKKGTSAVGTFFKKGGTLEKGVSTVANGVNSAANFVGKGVALGTKIVNGIDKIPILGAALAPATSFARTALGYANVGVNAAHSGANALTNAIALRHGGASAAAIGNNLLEKAKSIKTDVKSGVKYL